MRPLCEITPFTLLDFKDTPSAIFWFAGCNLRCRYCHNPEIVLGEGQINEYEAFEFLRTRMGMLEGVVLSGGECTLYSNLPLFVSGIKRFGMKVKVDTNGMSPSMLKTLIDDELIDFVSLDYKAPAHKWKDICLSGSESLFWKSLEILLQSKIEFEVRTTWHPDLLNADDINNMFINLKSYGYEGDFYIQKFQNSGTVLDQTLATSALFFENHLLLTEIKFR
jgi:pyruvate formate lyase activating enzyme